jgi:hypothetical protein
VRTLVAAGLATVLAGPATVDVRIEGDRATLFEGTVTTAARVLDGGDGTGAHPCAGDRPADPRPTAGTALADAGAAWAGTWNPDFRDFFVERIGPDASQPPTAYWAVLVNGRYALGACREIVQTGDEVLWAFDTTARPLILALHGPAHARAGEPVTVTVRDAWVRGDGTAGGPVAGAHVGGAVTDGAGRALVRFATPGAHVLKAERTGAVRSNALHVRVEPAPPGTDPQPPAEPQPRTRITAVGRRRVRGTIAPPPLAGSRLEIALRGRRRCVAWNRRLRWTRCRGRTTARTIPARARWRIALPRRLPPGRYRLTARLAGPAGREPVERGRNRVTLRHPRRPAGGPRRARRPAGGSRRARRRAGGARRGAAAAYDPWRWPRVSGRW